MHALSHPASPSNLISPEPADKLSASQLDPIDRFYLEYPSLAGELPHHNLKNSTSLLALKVSCDDCDCVLSLSALHGVINDYAHCTEVRYVATCPSCSRVVHNVLRLAGDEMRFIKDGQWCVATRRPWWHCLWPWPVDREWS